MARKTTPKRVEVLETAAELTSADRAKTYGDPSRNMECMAEYLAVWRKFADGREEAYAPGHDAAMVMVLAKIARITVGARGHMDNYIDAAAYLGIAYEAD